MFQIIVCYILTGLNAPIASVLSLLSVIAFSIAVFENVFAI